MFHPGPASLTTLDRRDASLADRLADELRGVGWSARWTAEPGGSWRAAISAPGLPHPIAGRGRSRLAAISAAHVDAIAVLTRPRPSRSSPLTRETSAC